ncbi:MAG: hypothetical protein WAW13_04620 [Minisyncoccia bacterium]
MSKFFLPIPQHFSSKGLWLYCGNLSVELTLFFLGKIDHLSGKPMPVSSKFFGGMLPWDIVKSLETFGVCANMQNLANKSDVAKIVILKEILKKGQPPTVLVGMGLGHHLTVYGFDDEEECFYCLDAGASDTGGITKISYARLLKVWGRNTLPLKLLSFYCRVFPQDRLRVEPFTLVVAQ